MQNNLFGVIDIGSNTIRLVVFKNNEWGFSEEQNLKIPARLRSYMTDDQVITDEGVQVIIDCLKKFQEVTRYHQVESIDAVATAAVRQAKNRSAIMEKVQEETDFTIRILSGEEEAYYGYLSVVHTTNVENGYTVDMGGGSTEVTLIQDREMTEFHSFSFGALSLFNKFMKNEQPSKGELKEMTEFVQQEFASIPWLTKREVPLVGIGGSARNMALVHHADNGYPLSGIHHYEIPAQDLKKIGSKLLSLSYSDRKKVDGLSKDRADTIIPAIYALNQLADHIEAEPFMMCRSGLREGVMYQHLSENNQLNLQVTPRDTGIRSLIAKYKIDTFYTHTVKQLAVTMLEKLENTGTVTINEKYKQLMEMAANVFYLGEHMESESASQHTFYILSNTSLEGMNHQDRISFALLASYKNTSTFQDFIDSFTKWYSDKEVIQLEILGSILKLTYFLNVTNREVIEDMTIDYKEEDGYTFTFTCHTDPYFEEVKSQKHKKHLEKKLNSNITLIFENK